MRDGFDRVIWVLKQVLAKKTDKLNMRTELRWILHALTLLVTLRFFPRGVAP